MLSQDDILRVIAKFTAEQIDATDVGCVVSDANPHGDCFTRFQYQIVEGNFRNLYAIHKAAAVGDLPDL